MAKRHIVLFCVNGMSSGLVVERMQQAANKEGYDCEVISYALGNSGDVAKLNPDCVLLSPQARYLLPQFQQQMSCPVANIDMLSFGRMNGAAVLKQAKELMGDV